MLLIRDLEKRDILQQILLGAKRTSEGPTTTTQFICCSIIIAAILVTSRSRAKYIHFAVQNSTNSAN